MITEELRLATAGTEWVLEKHTWHQKKLGAPTFGICQKSMFQREMAKAIPGTSATLINGII
jgi:hypothetical protein